MTLGRFLKILVFLGAGVPLLANVEPVRVACIGNSITAGAMLSDSESEAYPAVLARLLGGEYEVENFGVSGATLLRQGDKPYWDEPALREASEFNPQIAIIELGTNDSKAANWDVHAHAFAGDAAALIAYFAALPSRPAIWVCLPPPAYSGVGGIRESVLGQIRNALRRVAAREGARVVDVHAALAGKPELLTDGVHPTSAGAELLAQTIAIALTTPPEIKSIR